MDVTKELQEELITGLLKDSHFFSETKDEIDDSYFRDGACKVIYKALSVYYKKYNSIPTLNEMLITIDDCYSLTAGVTLAEVKDTVCRLYEMPKADEAFLYDKMTSFIYNIRLMQGLPKVITEFKNNSNDLGIVAQVLKSLDINFNTSSLFTMNDINQVKEARLSAIGSEDQSKIIKSFIPTVNNCLMFGGWQPGTVNMIVAPPGCFTGDTKIMTLDGESHTLQELYDNKINPGVYGADTDATISVGLSDGIYLSDYVDELIDVEIDNEYHIKCTPDHPFMLRDGSYKKAEDLKEFDELMPVRREYRVAQRGGRRICKKSEGYECVVNGEGQYKYTHQLSAESISHLSSETQIHHKDFNKLNNYPSNLMWMSTHDHYSLHYKNHYETNEKFRNGHLKNKFKKGFHASPETEFTSEQTRNRNFENWKKPEYRELMRPVSVLNGKKSKMINELNYSKEFQKKTQRGKVLSFINRLFIEFPGIILTENNYNSYAEQSSAKRKVWLNGIRKYFNESWNEIIKLAKDYNHKVTKITKLSLEEKVPVYGVVDAKPYGNYAIALDNEHGVFVHNTGKSMFLINEGVSAAKQGFDVLHIFIGDMVNYDGYIRYLSCMSNTNQGSLIGISLGKQQEIVKFCNQQYNNITDRIAILSYPSLSLTINSLMENINRLEAKNKKDFDMIIIDYPDNLLQEGKSLYEDGGTLYSSLERLARLTKSVVLVASQPSKIYWNYSIIPLEGASESSKKQQCVDVMLTFNTETRGAKIGSLHLVKARKGEEGSIIRIKTDYARCHMEEIDEAEFNILKDQLKLNPVGPKNNV